jgi:hypothetical protein
MFCAIFLYAKRPTSEFKLNANELISLFDDSDSDSDVNLSSSADSHTDEVPSSKQTLNSENESPSFNSKKEADEKFGNKKKISQNNFNDFIKSINLLFQSVCSFITLNCYLLVFLIAFLETSQFYFFNFSICICFENSSLNYLKR